MAKSATSWEGRRAMTDSSSTSPDAFGRGAKELSGLDQLAEAVVFSGLAGDETLLNELIDKAVEEGNFFIFNSAFQKLKGQKPSCDQLERLISAAEKSGRNLYAQQARNYMDKNY